jgi:hypothetical protein
MTTYEETKILLELSILLSYELKKKHLAVLLLPKGMASVDIQYFTVFLNIYRTIS